MKLYISPHPMGYNEDGRGSGGIWRVIGAQAKYLPECGIEIVEKVTDADVVNVHASALVGTDKPIVHSCHGYYWTGDVGWPREYWEQNIAVIECSRRAVEIIVPSEWVSYPIRRDLRKSPFVIRHGVELEEFEPSLQHEGYVLWGKPRVDVVSHPAPMNRLAKLAPSIRFISTLGTPTQNVEVIGAQPHEDFKNTIAKAAVWLATARETGDIASCEAMAMGVPVLGWNWGGTAELVQHLETGYLAVPGNDEDLLNGLHYCLEHRGRLGDAGREYIKAHRQWKDIIPRYAEVYAKALKESECSAKVSVIIPTHNYAHFLSECLESVLRQSMWDFEIIVVDDGSTDNTAEVLKPFCDGFDNVRVLRQENQGLVSALNAGHEAATGKYVVNLDADNILPPRALEILSGALDEKPQLDVVGGGIAHYVADGEHRLEEGWPFGKISAQAQLDHYNQLHSSAMMRRVSVERLGGYRVRQKKNEDAEFWCRAMSAGLRFEQVTKEPTLVYRWHGENKSKAEGGEDHPDGPLSWNFYFPWRKKPGITPFAMIGKSPRASWPVRSYYDPHITVVTACGPGHDKYLVDALDSMAGQTFQGFECVVGNETGKPLDVAAMGHPWVRVVDSPGRSPATARNAAIAAARAPLIVPLDADDMFYPRTLEMLYSAWLEKPDNLVYADCFIEDSPGHRKLYHSGPWSWKKIEREAIYQVVILYAKQWWEAVGGYDDSLPWEDWIFGLKLHFSGIGATWVREPWGVYRHWTGRKSDDDAIGFGTPEFKERLQEVYAQIEIIEDKMACPGCRKKASSRQSAISSKSRAVSPQSKEDGEKSMLIVYEGPRGGSFSLNSKAARGKKYRIKKGEPFTVAPGDGWIINMGGFRSIEVHEVTPTFPGEPPTPPVIPTMLTGAPVVEPEPEPKPEPEPEPEPEPKPEPKPEPEPKPQPEPEPVPELEPAQPNPNHPLAAKDLVGVSPRMLMAMRAMGLRTMADLRAEFGQNGHRRLSMIRGLKDTKLERLQEYVTEWFRPVE